MNAKGWTFEPIDATRENPPQAHEMTKFWGRVKDEQGRFVSHIGQADAEALFAQSESAATDADDARRFRALLIDPEGARHLLYLLQQGKGDKETFRQMIDRIEASREAARG